jgi:hypothetical protein
MPHGVESLKLWRVETEKHGFLCLVSLINYFFVLFWAQMDKSIVEKNQYDDPY